MNTGQCGEDRIFEFGSPTLTLPANDRSALVRLLTRTFSRHHLLLLTTKAPPRLPDCPSSSSFLDHEPAGHFLIPKTNPRLSPDHNVRQGLHAKNALALARAYTQAILSQV